MKEWQENDLSHLQQMESSFIKLSDSLSRLRYSPMAEISTTINDMDSELRILASAADCLYLDIKEIREHVQAIETFLNNPVLIARKRLENVEGE